MAQHACDLTFLSRSDGSALYSIGLTAALASVNGPGDVKVSNRLYNRSHVEVCYSPSTGHPMIRERALESIIMRTVEKAILVHLHPRTAINISIQEMQSDGLALSVSVNAACLALLDAGIQMKTTFAAITCCITPFGTILIDPTEAEIQESVAEATFVFDGSGEAKVLTALQDGHLSYEDFKRCLQQCQEASKDVFAFYRGTIEKKYQNEIES
ncbi:Exosome complex component RRP46 [Chionoecetes opilio]|uniref:Exosome complex component RRP46 n=1 Tax=Chionoecetes opilio TaxID=41210 RepID=A0A8J4Y0I2_CHIOP|nr:Exosome complex component RRP46 [Chionoecetes opilio]